MRSDSNRKARRAPNIIRGGQTAVARFYPEDERVARLHVQALQVERSCPVPFTRAPLLNTARAYFAVRELRRIAFAATLDVLKRNTCKPQVIARRPAHDNRSIRHNAQQLVARR